MKKKGISLFIFLMIVLQTLIGQDIKYINGVIRVKIKPQLLSSTSGFEVKSINGKITTGVQSLDVLNSKYSATQMKRVFPYSSKYEERHMKHGLHLWYDIYYNPTVSSSEVINAYSRLPEIEITELVHLPALNDGAGKPTYITKSTSEIPRSSVMPFNDPYLPKQWHYNNYGQTNGTPGADINLFNAWNITKGTPNVVVAIMDQGVDYKHDDLKNMMWVNQAELNGITGVDDDDNGFTDDIYGADFSDYSGDIEIGFHGTHVAGTIAAQNNNGIGVSGIAGGSGNNDGVRVMTCQIMGGAIAANIADAYVYAADMGAVISQNSWGYTSSGIINQSVHDAIDYFIAEAGNYPGSPMRGGIVIFASGNESSEELYYPGAYASVIAVDALGSRSFLASYSNFGTWTDISAPGGDSQENQILNPPAGYSNGVLSTLNSNTYGFLDGTSMACPHVSGIAALVVSKYGGFEFTNTQLKNHLLTGVRNIYELPGNIPYLGKMGSGYSDAILALAFDNKIAPNKITNLNLTGISQDFASLEWSVPVDEDDSIPVSFEVLYSESEINASNIAFAKKFNIKNFKRSGELQFTEIQNLKSLTNYYFSVRSIDRWGNISDFSNVITVKTNDGPIAELDALKTSLEINIDVNQNSIGTDSIKFSNNGEGLLRWDALSRIRSTEPLSGKPDLQYPVALEPNSPQLGLKSKELELGPLNNIQRDTLIDKGYINNFQSLYVIGETNLNLTNSSATRFYVPSEDGFNLTYADAYLEWNPSTGPVILEVYEGYNISDAKLLYAQEIHVKGEYGGFTEAKLDEQIYFEKGTYFWLVYHIPPGNLYPLGAGFELEPSYSKHSYISLNAGKSWTMLEELYKDTRFAWAVYAMSTMKNIDKFIVLSPDTGMIAPNQFSYINASVDGSNLINGVYKSNVVINTNETGKSMLRVPVNLNITGHLPVIQSIKRVDFGGVIVGNTKLVKVKFDNTGLGRFNFKTPLCTFTNPQFKYINGIKTVFDAKTSQELTFSFSPVNTGNNFSKVTLVDANGNNYTFELFGAGLEPPVAELIPAQETYNNLTIGDSINNHFFVKNIGNYPLDYFLPAFADGKNMESVPANIEKFGYSYQFDTTGASYVWNDISSTGKDITSNFGGDIYSNIYTKIPLNFLFPFYGKNENSIFISKYGLLAFDDYQSLWSAQPMQYKYVAMPKRYIAGCGVRMNFDDAGFGKIFYKQEADKLVVQYEDVPFYNGVGYNEDFTETFKSSLTFQIVLYDNGNIDFIYKACSVVKRDYVWSLIAMEDKTKNDGILFYNRENPDNFKYDPHSVIRIQNPGLGLYQAVTNPFGTIMPGDSARIDYSIKTDSLYQLLYKENLVIVTNDPAHNPSVYSANMNITNGGAPLVSTDSTSFNFGTVFKDDVLKRQFLIFNNGKATDSIKQVTFDNGYYSIIGNVPEILKPERQIPYEVSINTVSIGLHNDTMRITMLSGNVIKIPISGEVIQGPVIELLNTSGAALANITRFLNAGTTTSVDFKIKNAGAVNLTVAPVSNYWAAISEKDSTQNEFAYSYCWKTSRNFGGPAFEWIEIAGNGGTKVTGINSWEIDKEWSEPIILPFKFNFYGNDYDTLYIGYNGLVTFTKNQNEVSYLMGPRGEFPDTIQPNNFIAPLFLSGQADWIKMYPLAGQYYKIEQDRVVIEYRDYNSLFVMGQPVSFQVILFNDGNIKFQYLIEVPDNWVMDMGVAGIENIDGTDGLMISNRSNFIDSSMSVMMYPVRTYSIAPGDEKDFKLNLTAEELVAGTYTDSLEFYCNDPLAKIKKLPVKLIVSGTPQIVVPDTVSFGDVMVDPSVSEIIKEFQVLNTGTADLLVTNAVHTYPGPVKLEAYVFNNGTLKWITIAPTSNVYPLTIRAKSSLKFRATINASAPLTINDNLVISTTLTPSNYQVNLHAAIFNPAVLEPIQDSIFYYAQTAQFDTIHHLILKNTGGYKLNYKANIVYQRDTSVTTSLDYSNKGMKSTSVGKIQVPFEKIGVKQSIKTKSLKETTFNNVLKHDTATVPSAHLGYNGTSTFYTATGFNAPETGFSLSHVQTWYAPGSWPNSKIGVLIYAGDENINNTKLIWEESFNYTAPQADDYGVLLTFKLSKGLKFFPGEKFFVVFKYETSVLYPQGCSPVNNNVANRYLFTTDQSMWEDLSAYPNFKTIGWLVRAAEETSSASPWVVLSSSDSSSVPQASTDTLLLNFDAINAEYGDNIATLNIKTNELSENEKKIVLHLRKNAGPVFDRFDKQNVNENGSISLSIIATDIEGDNFNVTMDSAYQFLSIVSVQTSSAQILGFNSVVKTINLQYSPDFNSHGINKFGFTATDDFGNKGNTSIAITVKNINRPPVAVPADTIKLNTNGLYKIFSISDFFTDPDNDIATVNAVSGDAGIAQVFISDGCYLLPISKGITAITFVATDMYGATATNIVQVNVSDNVTGIENLNELVDVSIFPNPTNGIVKIGLSESLKGEISLKVYDFRGVVIQSENFSSGGNMLKTLDFGNLPNGAYFIEIKDFTNAKTIKIIKN